jgi:hypothetical protein
VYNAYNTEFGFNHLFWRENRLDLENLKNRWGSAGDQRQRKQTPRKPNHLAQLKGVSSLEEVQTKGSIGQCTLIAGVSERSLSKSFEDGQELRHLQPGSAEQLCDIGMLQPRGGREEDAGPGDARENGT